MSTVTQPATRASLLPLLALLVSALRYSSMASVLTPVLLAPLSIVMVSLAVRVATNAPPVKLLLVTALSAVVVPSRI